MNTLPRTVSDIFPAGLSELFPYFSLSFPEPRDSRVCSGKGRKAEEWIEEYSGVSCSKSFPHDEPWLTIVALFGLFGNQSDLDSPQRLFSLNDLFETAYLSKSNGSVPPRFKQITSSSVEVCLPENLRFRRFLRESVFCDGPFHLYSDRCATLQSKLSTETASLEGNTNLDALISGRDENNRRIQVFIEAKFLSDISKDISYLPVRNQIARNVDCAMDLMTDGGKNLDRLNDFWFVLLTPGMFRTPGYGGPVNTPLDTLFPWRSRLYCYKMDDYLNPEMLRQDLPHWTSILSDEQWIDVSRRIGWMTFEQMVQAVVTGSLLPSDTLDGFTAFFRERCLID